MWNGRQWRLGRVGEPGGKWVMRNYLIGPMYDMWVMVTLKALTSLLCNLCTEQITTVPYKFIQKYKNMSLLSLPGYKYKIARLGGVFSF